MIEVIKDKAAWLLKSGRIDAFLALSNKHGHPGPHLFLEADELESLALGDGRVSGDSRYPLNKQLIHLARHYPEKSFGVLVRGCDERGLNTLYSFNQLDPDKIVTVGIACDQELALACECLRPFPEKFVSGKKAYEGRHDSVAELDGLELENRFGLWMKEFSRCLKCYGCRNICPMCFCKDCSLQCVELIPTGLIPPVFPIFHLVRAMDMASRCIDCGLCAEVCPVGIPLRILYKKMIDIMAEEFDFRPGYQPGVKSPLNTLDSTI